MLRTDKIKIFVEFDDLPLDKKGILKLGAENKLAVYEEKTDASDKINLREEALGFPLFFVLGYYYLFKTFYFASLIVWHR